VGETMGAAAMRTASEHDWERLVEATCRIYESSYEAKCLHRGQDT